MSRVLLVGKGPPDRGGISAFLQRLLDGPLAREHDLRLLNLTRPDEVGGAGRFTASNVRRTLRDAAAVRRAAAGVDVVHVHTALVPLATLIRAGVLVRTARPRRNRVLLHVHSGLVEQWLHGRARRLLARLLLRPAHAVIACSEGSRRILAAALGDRVVLVDNGVDVEAFSPAERPVGGPPRVLYAGLVSPRKGVPDLVRASRLLLERGVEHELLLAGGTPDEGLAAEEAARREHSPSARWLGPQPHEAMGDLYRSADVFCLPSWWEAMPLAILEAMATGLPVVATPVGDVPRVVRPGATGLLVPLQDEEALADALEELLTDPAKRGAWGRAARDLVVRHHSAGAMAGEIGALYGATAYK